MKFHQPGPSSLSTLDLNANVNIGRRRTGDDISSSVLRTGELKIGIYDYNYRPTTGHLFPLKIKNIQNYFVQKFEFGNKIT